MLDFRWTRAAVEIGSLNHLNDDVALGTSLTGNGHVGGLAAARIYDADL